jgi:hypothetical protein
VGIAYDDEGDLLPGYTLDEGNNAVFVGGELSQPHRPWLMKAEQQQYR